MDYGIKENEVNSLKPYIATNYIARQAELTKSQRHTNKQESNISPLKNK